MTDTKIINRALELVRDGLRSGGIPKERFDMGYYGVPQCGTAGCIGGWLLAVLQLAYPKRKRRFLSAVALSESDHHLFELFVPLGIRKHWSEITPAQAAIAIDRYLTGKRPWTKVRS